MPSRSICRRSTRLSRYFGAPTLSNGEDERLSSEADEVLYEVGVI